MTFAQRSGAAALITAAEIARSAFTAAMPQPHRPEALTALADCDRMGDRSAAEAGANHGQGLRSATGHDNLAMLAEHLGMDVDHARVTLTADNPIRKHVAATFVAPGCLPLADRDDVAGTTHAVDGGSFGGAGWGVPGFGNGHLLVFRDGMCWISEAKPPALQNIADPTDTSTTFRARVRDPECKLRMVNFHRFEHPLLLRHL